MNLMVRDMKRRLSLSPSPELEASQISGSITVSPSSLEPYGTTVRCFFCLTQRKLGDRIGAESPEL